MLNINTRYVCKSPGGTEKIVKITSPDDAAFYEKYIPQGYTFTEVPQSAPPANVCISCEG